MSRREGTLVEVAHVPSRDTRTLTFVDWTPEGIGLAWSGVGTLRFDQATGFGREKDCRDWRITDVGREALGIAPFREPPPPHKGPARAARTEDEQRPAAHAQPVRWQTVRALRVLVWLVRRWQGRRRRARAKGLRFVRALNGACR